MSETRISYNRLRLPERDALSLLLNSVCTKGEDGYAVYADGWDDERVVAEMSKKFSREISAHAVAGYRRGVYGNVRRPAQPDPENAIFDLVIDSLRAENAGLRNRIALLEQERLQRNNHVAELQGHMNALFARLAAVEGRVGIRHANNPAPVPSLLGERLAQAAAAKMAAE